MPEESIDPPTPDDAHTVTFDVIAAVRAAFMEGRQGISIYPVDDLNAWNRSQSKDVLSKLSRRALAVFVKEGEASE